MSLVEESMIILKIPGETALDATLDCGSAGRCMRLDGVEASILPII